MRLRSNFISGTVSDNPLTAGATTLNSVALANLPALTAGDDYYALILDPAGPDEEIVYVTAHTASATSATIVRGRENTTGVEQASDTVMVHGPTAIDYVNSRYAYDLDYPKHTDDTVDDNFDGTSLDGAWTVEDGTTGTPDILTVGTSADIYDVDDGLWCQMWATANRLYLTKAYTLAVDDCIVLKTHIGVTIPDTGGVDGGSQYVIFSLQDNATYGNTENITVRAFVNSGGLEAFVAAATHDGSIGSQTISLNENAWQPGAPIWLRIIRSATLVYETAYSLDGVTWSFFVSTTATAEQTQLYISVFGTNATSTNLPITLVDYVRQGGKDVRPW